MSLAERVRNTALHYKSMSAEAAAELIPAAANVGMSGSTGASDPKVLPQALARRIERLPDPSYPVVRQQINAGQMQYTDLHLSHAAQLAWFGFLGHPDAAVVEVAGILPDGRLIPSSSVDNNKTWPICAAPRRRSARLIIEKCAHPDFLPALHGASGRHTPHLLDEALSWHARYVETGHILHDANPAKRRHLA
jgi:acyl-CoA hydrolase